MSRILPEDGVTRKQTKGKSGGTRGGDDDDDGNTCRVSVPPVLREELVISIVEKVTGQTEQDRVKKTRFELHSRCNDGLLNRYVRPIIEVWHANMDVCFTVDVGKIIDYMMKYVTKAETASSSTARDCRKAR
jgi:hypothetical protein